MEILSRLLQKKQDEKKITGFKVSSSSPSISHLLFADDVFIFCKATLDEAHEILQTLNQFASITGQTINYDKSSAHYSKNFPPRHKRMIRRILKIKEMKDTERYLGTPLFLGHTKMEMFDDLITRVTSRIEGWKANLLSQAGRTVLINSVTTAIPAYQMSVFSIPKTIKDMLNAIQRDFWWGRKKMEKRFCI
ncbi:hypothetical protein ACHQM5_024250 [Ranunculus cassubicifolius]